MFQYVPEAGEEQQSMPQYQPVQPQQQQQAGGIDPMQGLAMYNQFAGGGGMFGGGGAAAGGGGAAAGGGAATGAGGTAAGGAAAGGGGMGGALAAAGPWAALAAVVIANESEARDGGYRDEDDWEYAKDVMGGKVLEQDMEKRWMPKLFGEDLENDHLGIGAGTLAGANLLTGDFSNAWDYMKDSSLIGKLF